MSVEAVHRALAAPALQHRLRWYAKKLARASVARASSAAGRLAKPAHGGPRVHVLTYHRFGDVPYDPFCVSLDEFDRQMRWLAESRRAIAFADLLGFVRGERTIGDGSVLITVDDGCPSFFDGALPILVKYGIPVVAFVPAGEITADARAVDPTVAEQPTDRVTVSELGAMARQGVTIGSHAWTHDSLGSMTLEEAREQLTRSRTALERHTGAPVLAFAYPYGTRADFNDDTARLVREAGYACAFTSQHGAVVGDSDPFALPRVKVEGGEGLGIFRLLVDGALDAWSWVDRALWRMQASGR